jgi:hypothetical protein
MVYDVTLIIRHAVITRLVSHEILPLVAFLVPAGGRPFADVTTRIRVEMYGGMWQSKLHESELVGLAFEMNPAVRVA